MPKSWNSVQIYDSNLSLSIKFKSLNIKSDSQILAHNDFSFLGGGFPSLSSSIWEEW